MATARLDSLITNLTSIEKKVIDTIQGVIKENEAWIVELNSEDQLYEKGINRKGVAISDYEPYSSVTISIKREKGQPTGRVTLRDTGGFQRSFHIEYGSDTFEIKASDWKTDELIKKYGGEILGLTDENMRDIADSYITPALVKLFKSL